ncbi:MAG TPA: amidase [Thermoanaerobaculia bacterium]|nr:amidase [Thermoanaerobaculia bacterium]
MRKRAEKPPGETAGFKTLAAALRAGRLPLAAYIDRLEARCGEREPALGALLPEPGRFDRLRREARALLVRYPRPASRPPLFGVAVAVKDVFRVEDWPTRAGSQLPAELFTGPEADCVTRLKQAGALVLGKTVSTEFAYFAPGATRNPHHLEHTPGGSSSGSAAAVGAGLCPLALGTQTIGSTIRPAAYCGVVGFKPSYGRISAAGLIPLAPSLDHVGVLAAEVAVAEAAAALLCRDWRAPALLRRRRPRLGVPEGPYLAHASAGGLASFRATCERLAAAGFAVEPVAALPDFDEIVARNILVVAAEAAAVHAPWFGRYRELYHPRSAELIERGQQVGRAALVRALAGREELRRELETLMDAHRLDAWLSPSAPGPAPHGLESTGDPVMNVPWTHAGLPALGLPSAMSPEGLPLGLQVVGRYGGDEALLAAGRVLERTLRPAPGSAAPGAGAPTPASAQSPPR